MSIAGEKLAGDELSGELAPPMANGEVVFEAPWQGRVFGMARTMAESGIFTWDEFRERLIAAVGRWEASAEPAAEYHYYTHFQAALEQLLVEKKLIDRAGLQDRVQNYLARPADHDHDHNHDREHDDGHDH